MNPYPQHMASIVDFTISEQIDDLKQLQLIKIYIAAQVSQDDSDDDDIAVIVPQNWTLTLPYNCLDPEKGKLFNELETMLAPMLIRFFKPGVDRLHESVLRFVLAKDLSRYSAKHIPEPSSPTIH